MASAQCEQSILALKSKRGLQRCGVRANHRKYCGHGTCTSHLDRTELEITTKTMFVALLYLVLVTSVSIAGAQDCLQNYADVETALIDDSANAYQIARAFFRPRADGETLCVTAYYHVGLNSTEEEDKSNCPSVTIGSNQELTGCSKWKWCINTFYMDLNITQLQVFSFFIIFERTAEIDLRIPPFCVSEETMNEYLLRATNSVSYNYIM